MIWSVGKPEQVTYWAVTGSTALCWSMMIAAPRSRVTARVMGSASPLILGGLALVHAGAIAAGGARPADLVSPEAMRRSTARPAGFAAVWAHMLAFDLLAGRRVWQDGLRDGRDTRAALLVIWGAGPLALLLYPRLRA